MQVLSYFQRWWLRGLMLMVMGSWVILVNLPLAAQPSDPSTPTPQATQITVAPEPIDGYPVHLGEQELFLIQAPLASFTPAERAETINRRLLDVAEDSSLDPAELTLQPDGDGYRLILGSRTILSITTADAKAAQLSTAALAQTRLKSIATEIRDYREKRSVTYLSRSLLIAVTSGVLLVIALRILGWLSHLVFSHVASWRSSQRIPALRFGQVQLLTAERVADLLLTLFRLLRLGILLGLGYIFLSVEFSLFPWTENLGLSMSESLRRSLENGLRSLVNYLPNLGALLLIGLFTYYSARITRFFFNEIKQNNVRIPGFYAEWADPTFNLVLVGIIVIAAVTAVPYLPGFGTPAFQGVSFFVGLLAALGSTATVANVVAGLILIYSRAFQLGDRVKIGDVLGDVVEKSLLATRIKTPLNVYITIPNSTVLNNYVANFSTTVSELQTPLLLSTTITLGYDVPWRDVHEVLVAAGKATPLVLDQPDPFVFQVALNDFHVSYTLHIYTNHPQAMAVIVSQLHQNIQDRCNESGIEIMSPTYSAIRDGNSTTIPAKYLPPDYRVPGFRLSSLVDFLRPPS